MIETANKTIILTKGSDEYWKYGYGLETKVQALQCKFPSFLRPQNEV